GGITASNTREITADNLLNASESIPVGIAATAGAAGVMTMPTGHGLQNGDKVAVSGAFGVYYNGEVSEAGANAITVSGGAGDALPVSGDVVVAKQVEIDLAFDGTQLAALSLGGDISLAITLETSATVALAKSTIGNGAYQWDSGNGETNPITGDDIVKAHVYNRGIVAGTATIMVGYDND
ncbi:MAG: hypothetical protein PHV59_12915, partial [Victivallales bacterium]|nr:hypothetical protein [Victivallales bacterium]